MVLYLTRLAYYDAN